MKRLQCWVLLIVLLITLLPAQPAFAAERYGTLSYTVTSVGTLVITGTGDMKEEGSNEDYPWYRFRDAIREVVIGPGITSIGPRAFKGYNHLKSVSAPEGLAYIGESAFYNCDSLSQITFLEGLAYIGDSAFSFCDSLSQITFPEGLTHIGESAFLNCDSLSQITFPEGLTHIEDFAFYNCDSLSQITFPEGLAYIGESAFLNCDNLSQVTLPEGLAHIGDFAFSHCDSLSQVTLPESLTHIGNCAFAQCGNLTVNRLPQSAICGTGVFRDCGKIPGVFWHEMAVQLRTGWQLLVFLGVLLSCLLLGLWLGGYPLKKKSVLAGVGLWLMVWALYLVLGWWYTSRTRWEQGFWTLGVLCKWLEPLDPGLLNVLTWVWWVSTAAVVGLGSAAYVYLCCGAWLRGAGKLRYGAGLARVVIVCLFAWPIGWCVYRIDNISEAFYLLPCGASALGLLALGWRRLKNKKLPRVRLLGLAAAVLVTVRIFAGKHFGWEIGPIRKEMWDVLLWILLGLCLAAAGYYLLPAVKKALQKPRETEWWPDWGKYVHIGILVAAVVAGYCIFSVLANGCFKSEYFAEQITVTHTREDSETQTRYCVDFVTREVTYAICAGDGTEQELWSRPLSQEALDEFVDTCNEKALLGADGIVPAVMPGTYCQVTTYSVLGERLVYSSTLDYPGDLENVLNRAFYDLTGVFCLTTP